MVLQDKREHWKQHLQMTTEQTLLWDTAFKKAAQQKRMRQYLQWSSRTQDNACFTNVYLEMQLQHVYIRDQTVLKKYLFWGFFNW